MLVEHFDTANDANCSSLMLELARALEGDPNAAPRTPRLILSATDRAGLRHPFVRTEAAELVTLTSPALCRLFPAKGKDAQATEEFSLEWSGFVERQPDRFRFWVYPDAGCGFQVSAESSFTSAVGVWHHVAGVFDAGAVRLYVDGTLAASVVQLNPISWTPAIFGHWAGRDGLDARPNRGAFIGEIDEIRVSRTARYSGATIAPPPHLFADADTVAAWLLEEGTGAIVAADAMSGVEGTVTGATWVVSSR